MTRRFVSYDPMLGITTWFEGDGQGNMTLTYESDVEAVLEHNAAARNNGTNGRSKEGEFWYAGEIPMATIQKWMVEEHIDVFDPNDWPKVKQRLNSNEWFKLRTSSFRI